MAMRRPATNETSTVGEIPILVLGLILIISACGGGPTGPAAQPSIATSPDSTTSISTADTECQVTQPNGFQPSPGEGVTYTEELTAPDPYPVDYPDEGMAWHGSDELWTALPVDGKYRKRKSVWWSVNFPGGTVEERPALEVTWTRLDGDGTVDNDGNATNAYTAEEGWFMIGGIDPDEPGCWQVEATYKGAALSYVYEQA